MSSAELASYKAFAASLHALPDHSIQTMSEARGDYHSTVCHYKSLY